MDDSVEIIDLFSGGATSRESNATAGGGGYTPVTHGHSCMSIDPRIPAMARGVMF